MRGIRIERASEREEEGQSVRLVLKGGKEKSEVYNFYFWPKCTFSPSILTFFHFSPYILFLSFLVPKPINAGHLSPCSTILLPN